jgi:gamma-glutamylcyclotransferase (GGCT)/AIG2-like uncharacterized protein YtfP
MVPAKGDPAAIDPDRLIGLYGTLRDAELRRSLGLAGRVRRLGRFRLQGILYDLGPYPALGTGTGIVHGELYEVLDAGIFPILDKFEEFDPARPKLSTYLRERWRLMEPDVECWVYRYNKSVRGLPRVLGGDWLARRKRRASWSPENPFGNN